MAITSNVDRVDSWLQAAIKGVNFEMPGPISTLGHDMTVVATEGIQKRSYQDQRGKSEVWPENSEPYRTEKEQLYDIDKTNYRTSQMLSTLSVLGEQHVADGGKTYVWQYGEGRPPSSSLTGHLSASDLAITDREKAEKAHAEGRPFFELDEDINTQKILPVLAESLGKYLQEKANS